MCFIKIHIHVTYFYYMYLTVFGCDHRWIIESLRDIRVDVDIMR